jgi:hypothetical protein
MIAHVELCVRLERYGSKSGQINSGKYDRERRNGAE